MMTRNETYAPAVLFGLSVEQRKTQVGNLELISNLNNAIKGAGAGAGQDAMRDTVYAIHTNLGIADKHRAAQNTVVAAPSA